MSYGGPPTRRDPRANVPPETALLEFCWAGLEQHPLEGEVVTISATGLAFALADDPGIEVGTMLTSAKVRVDETIVEGDLSVRYSRPAEGSPTEFGCLFYPASLDDSTDWMLFVKQRTSSDSSPPPQLAQRCSNCYSIVWIYEMSGTTHPCSMCKQEYRYDRPIRRGRLLGVYQRARGMAVELGIDVPSAVSMMLGILTLSDVREIIDDAPADWATAAPDEARKSPFDRAFLPAIEAGTLTEAQAIQRGNRESFAKRLIARHRISLDDAYAVADNRTSLLSLLRKRAAGRPITATYDQSTNRPHGRLRVVAALAGVALLVGVGIVHLFDNAVNDPNAEMNLRPTPSGARPTGAVASSMPAPPGDPDLADQPVESYARVRADESGEILHVEATDPGNALLAFCKSQESRRRLQPLDVVPTDPPSDVARIGLMRDLDEASGYRVVVIRRDPQTQRWFLGNTGDPEAPVSIFPAPERLVRQVSDAL